MAKKRKASFNVPFIDEDDVFGCAAAAAAAAALSETSICEHSLQMAVTAASTASPTTGAAAAAGAHGAPLPIPIPPAALISVESSVSLPSPASLKFNPEPFDSGSISSAVGYFLSEDMDGSTLKIPIMNDNNINNNNNDNDENTNKEASHDEKKDSDDALSGSSGCSLMEAIMNGSYSSNRFRRNRYESWGGMSDLSFGGGGSILESEVTAAAALAAEALHKTGIIDDVTAAAASIGIPSPSDTPTHNSNFSICLSPMQSIASDSKDPDTFSLSNMKLPPAKLDPSSSKCVVKIDPTTTQTTNNKKEANAPLHLKSLAKNTSHQQHQALPPAVPSSTTVEISGDIKAMIAKAIASTGAGIGVKINSSNYSTIKKETTQQQGGTYHQKAVHFEKSHDNVCDVATLAALKVQEAMQGRRRIQYNNNNTGGARLSSKPTYTTTIPIKSTLTPNRINGVKSYSTPTNAHLYKGHHLTSGKGGKVSASSHLLPTPVRSNSKINNPSFSTPITSNVTKTLPLRPYTTHTYNKNLPMTTPPPRKKTKINNGLVDPKTKKKGSYRPLPTSSLCSPSTGGTGQSNQKWEDMFNCLVIYVKERRESETKGQSAEAKKAWEWDGNVPTTFKTKDGKALGRWINNQRSAKHKGTLKQDREIRLVSTGLKWSVLSTNAWPDMMNELRLYVRDKTKNGDKWDGNVPTNYRIKSNTAPDGTEIDEEKNLGRWINRQRSLYQGGRLKKERQMELEQIGLKWSVLSTTSWETMYEALCLYAKRKRALDPEGQWDGNVPANYKTEDSKSLGRWVNRQRSAFAKRKLKDEWVKKLNLIGLKWSVHERKSTTTTTLTPTTTVTATGGVTAPVRTTTILNPQLTSTHQQQQRTTLITTQQQQLQRNNIVGAVRNLGTDLVNARTTTTTTTVNINKTATTNAALNVVGGGVVRNTTVVRTNIVKATASTTGTKVAVSSIPNTGGTRTHLITGTTANNTALQKPTTNIIKSSVPIQTVRASNTPTIVTTTTTNASMNIKNATGGAPVKPSSVAGGTMIIKNPSMTTTTTISRPRPLPKTVISANAISTASAIAKVANGTVCAASVVSSLPNTVVSSSSALSKSSNTATSARVTNFSGNKNIATTKTTTTTTTAAAAKSVLKPPQSVPSMISKTVVRSTGGLTTKLTLKPAPKLNNNKNSTIITTTKNTNMPVSRSNANHTSQILTATTTKNKDNSTIVSKPVVPVVVKISASANNSTPKKNSSPATTTAPPAAIVVSSSSKG